MGTVGPINHTQQTECKDCTACNKSVNCSFILKKEKKKSWTLPNNSTHSLAWKVGRIIPQI